MNLEQAKIELFKMWKKFTTSHLWFINYHDCTVIKYLDDESGKVWGHGISKDGNPKLFEAVGILENEHFKIFGDSYKLIQISHGILSIGNGKDIRVV